VFRGTYEFSMKIHAGKLLREYVVKEYKDKKKGNYDLSDWEDFIPSNIPKQLNGYDCGVFMCRYAYNVSLNQPFKFSQKDMQYLRKRMV
jgi:sentrin-specific protease 1